MRYILIANRIRISKGSKRIVTFMDTVNNDKIIRPGIIGFMQEVNHLIGQAPIG